LQDILGSLLGSGTGGAGMGTRASGGVNLGALITVLGPLLAKMLKNGGLSKLVQNAQSSGLSAQADSWVGTGVNEPVDAGQTRAVVVQQLAREGGVSEDEAADVLAHVVPQVVNGLTPNGQLPSDQEVDDFLSRFEG
jgi:uncharacterized protein YidB (DUF937 family)